VRLLVLALLLTACGPSLGPRPEDRRGDTNGRMFDFVSSKPDGEEWVIRCRGDSMWVAYSTAKESKDYGETTLTAKESKKLWKLIDQVEVDGDEEVDPGDEAGTVLLRIREPTDDGEHDIVGVTLSRDTENDSVIDLASYLIDLVKAHHRVEPAF
jgi:hypothetical protein